MFETFGTPLIRRKKIHRTQPDFSSPFIFSNPRSLGPASPACNSPLRFQDRFENRAIDVHRSRRKPVDRSLLDYGFVSLGIDTFIVTRTTESNVHKSIVGNASRIPRNLSPHNRLEPVERTGLEFRRLLLLLFQLNNSVHGLVPGPRPMRALARNANVPRSIARRSTGVPIGG